MLRLLPTGAVFWLLLAETSSLSTTEQCLRTTHRASSAHLLPPATAFALSPAALLPLLERPATHTINQKKEIGI
jgi:hypothetical protein